MRLPAKAVYSALAIVVFFILAKYRSKLAPEFASLSSVTDQASRAPLVVTQKSSVVVMEYEAWFTSLHPLATIPRSYDPLLTSPDRVALGQPGYSSDVPAVIAQHMSWLEAMGVDAITAEQTNSGPCNMNYSNQTLCSAYLQRIGVGTKSQSDYIAFSTSVDNSTLNLYPALTTNGTAIKIIPLLDAQDPEMYLFFLQDGASKRSTGLENQLRLLTSFMIRYPQMNVIYEGKPLVMLFVGASQAPGVAGSILTLAQAFAARYKDKFTIRIMASLVGSQPALWSNANSAFGLREVNKQFQVWSWIDRLNKKAGILPSFTTSTGSRVEAFTVSSATQGTIVSGNDGAWNSADASLYAHGATFSNFMIFAKSLKPIFLFVDQFNEYAKPDQGDDIQHSNDIEPTKQWGFEKYNAVKTQLLDYKFVIGKSLSQ